MKSYSRLLMGLAVLLGTIGCDQTTKYVASETLRGAGRISMLADVFRLQYAENTGAFLGLGNSLPASVRFWVFTVLVGLLLLAASIYLVTNTSLPHSRYLGAMLFLAGGIGNLIDRIMQQGVVVDFMNLGIGSLRTGIFNVADVAIMAGGVLWVWQRTPKEKDSVPPEAPAPPGVPGTGESADHARSQHGN